MIVDDEPKITEAFVEAFEDEYIVIATNSGEDAMRMIPDNLPELLVLDWRLRGEIQGKDILVFMKQKYPNIPVYVVTASSHFVKEIKSLGADDCLLKPCPEPLSEKIRQTLPPC